MSDVGPQRATPKSFAALKAELRQKMDEIDWGDKKPAAAAAAVVEEENEFEWIKETEFYKEMEAAGCIMQITKDGILCIDPKSILKCNFL